MKMHTERVWSVCIFNMNKERVYIMYKNIFDSHAHYDARRFNKDRDQLLQHELPSKGVVGIMSVADTIESSENGAELAAKYPYIYYSAGIHPHSAKDATDDLESRIRRFARDPKMKAVGEIGLDYYRDLSPRDVQQDVFIRQLAVAEELNLPVIIHNRDATGDTMDILRKHNARGIMHSFSASAEVARELVEMDFYISFSGVLTYKNARRPVEAAAAVPIERLLLETDAPYLAPEPMRGERSDSSMIKYTAERMAEIKGMDTQELLDIVFENTCRVFDISPNALRD